MKSRDEIVIIMLQWMRLYTLGSRGSRELKTFLETRLIYSRVDQKLKNKGRNTLVLKRKLGLKSWVMERVVSAVLRGRGNDSLGRLQNSRIGSEFRFDFAPNGFHFSHDRATIGPRSGHDRCPGRWSIAVRSNGGDSTPLAPRSRLDRAAIAVRSNRDRGVLPLALHAVQLISR